MPIYSFRCNACDAERDEYRSLSDRDLPADCPCGGTMRQVPAVCGMAFITKGGNWMSITPATGHVTKGNRRPRTIGNGHGLGGRRKNPTLRKTDDGRVAVIAGGAK